MEGVLVSAKKDGSTITITVVSDAKGNFSFPAIEARAPASTRSRSAPSATTSTARRRSSRAPARPRNADIKLAKTKNIAAQMSNGEWIASVPGTEQQKLSLLNCVSCHTLERIVKSSYDKEGFQTNILPRMGSYANQSMPIHRAEARRDAAAGRARRRARAGAQARQAEFLSSINLSEASAWEYPLKTLPRPKGRGTKVVITEYDLPRPTIEPHDVIVGADGNAYYSNFGEQTFGMHRPEDRRAHRISGARAQEGLADRHARACVPTRTATCGSA